MYMFFVFLPFHFIQIIYYRFVLSNSFSHLAVMFLYFLCVKGFLRALKWITGVIPRSAGSIEFSVISSPAPHWLALFSFLSLCSLSLCVSFHAHCSDWMKSGWDLAACLWYQWFMKAWTGCHKHAVSLDLAWSQTVLEEEGSLACAGLQKVW